MSEMTPQESIERYNEGLKKAASRARELGKLQKNKYWDQIANSLDGIRDQGLKLFYGRPLTEQEVQQMIDKHATQEAIKTMTTH